MPWHREAQQPIITTSEKSKDKNNNKKIKNEYEYNCHNNSNNSKRKRKKNKQEFSLLLSQEKCHSITHLKYSSINCPKAIDDNGDYYNGDHSDKMMRLRMRMTMIIMMVMMMMMLAIPMTTK